MEYLYLFFVSFLSATIFPFGSEALFLYDLSIELNIFLLLIVASIGNTLGSAVNYYFGFKGEKYITDKKLATQDQLTKAEQFFLKYGGVCLLFSWVPIFGDGFTFVAGVLKYNRVKFIILVGIAKFGRYLFLVLGYLYFAN
jgi:membrane protein YqaA with SNARE-associated domain